jgi:hypothetical protein
MDSSRESSPDPLHRANVGTVDYPYDLPEDPREAGVHMWQMQREAVFALRRMEELILDHDQQIEALEGTTRKIAARTKDLRTMQKDHHIGLQQIHTAVHAIYYPEQTSKGKEKASGTSGPSHPTPEFSFSQKQENLSPEIQTLIQGIGRIQQGTVPSPRDQTSYGLLHPSNTCPSTSDSRGHPSPCPYSSDSSNSQTE